MIFRLALLIGLVFLFFKAKKIWQEASQSAKNKVQNNRGPEQITDVMVQDPQCQVYLPRSESLHVKHRGQDYYFCSRACQEQFFQNHPKS